MTQTLRMLAKEPKILKKLQKEVDLLPELNVETTKSCTYLAAVVNEALRLCNPLPSGAYAATPPSGVQVAGTSIPGNTQVIVSHLGLMTDERYFPKGEEFIPERWTGELDEGIVERKAFVPFGYGLHSCVGKQLALNEMKLGIASVVRQFDVVLGESYSEDVWQEEWKDYAVLQVGALPVKFLGRA
jgi:cytochrome P450